MYDTVLVVTRPLDTHADAVVLQLAERGVPVFRLHPEDFPTDVAVTLSADGGAVEGILETPHRQARVQDIGAAWYRRPNPPAIHDEVAPAAMSYCRKQAQSTLAGLYALLEGRWLVSPHELRRAEVKLVQLVEAARAGLSTPATIVTNSSHHAVAFRRRYAERNCVVKSLNVEPGSQAGLFWFPLTTVWDDNTDEDAIRYASVVVQPYVRKLLELRAVVIGDQVFCASVDSQSVAAAKHDVRALTSEDGLSTAVPYEAFSLPREVELALVRLTRSLKTRFASADLILTPEEEYVFLELNPNGQWLWLETEVGLAISSAIAEELMRISVETASGTRCRD